MLAMHLDDGEFERFLAPPTYVHEGPHRVYPYHEDVVALAEEIGEVFRCRLEANYLP